ncbi:arginine deiminase-related protein [soil metagenome]
MTPELAPELTPELTSELTWGRHYLMVEPNHFRVDYQINPYMNTAVQPDHEVALHQWRTLVSTIRELGGQVDVIPQLPHAPDMVYAMNLGLALCPPSGPTVVMSHMRHAERRMEAPAAARWFADRGFRVLTVGQEGVGPHLEAGDAFWYRDRLLVGHGPRTDELALKHLAETFDVEVVGFTINHPAMYHFDLIFCPLDSEHAIVAPAGLEPESARRLLDLVPEPLVITAEEATSTFAANSIVVGDTVVMPGPAPERVVNQLRTWGFGVVELDLSEFHKGGGSIRCMTNPIDVVIA